MYAFREWGDIMTGAFSMGSKKTEFKVFNTTFGQKGTISNTFSVAGDRIDRILVSGAIGHSGAGDTSSYSIKIYGISDSGASTTLATITGTRAKYETCHNIWNNLTVKNTYKSIKVDAYSSDTQASNNSIKLIVCV